MQVSWIISVELKIAPTHPRRSEAKTRSSVRSTTAVDRSRLHCCRILLIGGRKVCARAVSHTVPQSKSLFCACQKTKKPFSSWSLHECYQPYPRSKLLHMKANINHHRHNHQLNRDQSVVLPSTPSLPISCHQGRSSLVCPWKGRWLTNNDHAACHLTQIEARNSKGKRCVVMPTSSKKCQP